MVMGRFAHAGAVGSSLLALGGSIQHCICESVEGVEASHLSLCDYGTSLSS